ncbi:hypothetical protein SLA2020_398940 [Shorea laevis]
MAEQKVTTIVLNVDLQCSKCYKKVKNLLCKFSEIRDQAYDERANKVTIKVLCCCRKGSGTNYPAKVVDTSKALRSSSPKRRSRIRKRSNRKGLQRRRKRRKRTPKSPKMGLGNNY